MATDLFADVRADIDQMAQWEADALARLDEHLAGAETLPELVAVVRDAEIVEAQIRANRIRRQVVVDSATSIQRTAKRLLADVRSGRL